jgi:hypothetical protein
MTVEAFTTITTQSDVVCTYITSLSVISMGSRGKCMATQARSPSIVVPPIDGQTTTTPPQLKIPPLFLTLHHAGRVSARLTARLPPFTLQQINRIRTYPPAAVIPITQKLEDTVFLHTTSRERNFRSQSMIVTEFPCSRTQGLHDWTWASTRPVSCLQRLILSLQATMIFTQSVAAVTSQPT